MDKLNEKASIIKGSGGDGGGDGSSRHGSIYISALVTITHRCHCCFNARWGFEIYKVNTLRALSYKNSAITHTHSLSLLALTRPHPHPLLAAKIYFD